MTNQELGKWIVYVVRSEDDECEAIGNAIDKYINSKLQALLAQLAKDCTPSCGRSEMQKVFEAASERLRAENEGNEE